jgi:hypothetical protein
MKWRPRLPFILHRYAVRVATVIRRELAVRYHRAHVSRPAPALGLSLQRPMRQNEQRATSEVALPAQLLHVLAAAVAQFDPLSLAPNPFIARCSS